MVITDETIEYVGILAKLELSDEAREQAKKDMSNMLDYVSKLNELDTDNVPAMSHAQDGNIEAYGCGAWKENKVRRA